MTGPEPEAPDGSVSLEQLVSQVEQLIRRLGAQSVMVSQAVASRVGLHTTDLECLDLILLREEATPGELAKATGLTTGAVTALIDRLERRGYVERIPDPRDRRRVLLRVRPESIAAIQAVYRPMQVRMTALWSSFTAAQLATVAEFLSRTIEAGADCVEGIARMPPAVPRRNPARGKAARRQP